MGNLIRFDWAIKNLLRNKANFDVLEGFLSELLKTQIYIETILESEGNQSHATDKFNRADLLVKTAQGQHIIIELQCSGPWDYVSRILYGTSRVVCEQLKSGDSYRKIRASCIRKSKQLEKKPEQMTSSGQGSARNLGMMIWKLREEKWSDDDIKKELKKADSISSEMINQAFKK